MAEAVFRDLVAKAGLSDQIKIDSCGTGGWHVGEPAHYGTIEVLSRNSICTKRLVARQLTVSDFSEFDIIVAMDKRNESDIRAFAEKNRITLPEVRLLLSFASDQSILEVPDPYYEGKFDLVYELVVDGCMGLLKHIERVFVI